MTWPAWPTGPSEVSITAPIDGSCETGLILFGYPTPFGKSEIQYWIEARQEYG